MSQQNPRFSLFLRAIGVKSGFRRTGPSSYVNLAVAAAVGIVSGHYIFNEPLREYFEEQRKLGNLERKSSNGKYDNNRPQQ